MEAAEGNRRELEKVLSHYSSEGDSLKLKATQWLISNMPGHYSYANSNTVETFYDKVDSILCERGEITPAEVRFITDSLGRVLLDKRMVEDIRVVNADFLIRNIDESFRQWKEGAWAQHLNFEDFCEFLLPYKIDEAQPLDNWRNDLQTLSSPDFPDMRYCDELKNLTLQAAELMNAELSWIIGKDVETREFDYPVLRLSTRLKMPSGTCRDFASITASVMRANGIPVAVDFTPIWAGGGTRHTWCVVLAGTGKTEPFSPPFTRPGDIHRLTDRVAKVFRWTYAPNTALLELNKSGEYVPDVFKTPFLKDVTNEYVEGCEVSIPIREDDGGYVYLALYDNQKWVPVDFARIERGEAVFRNVGKGALYLPVSYDAMGRQRAIGNPVMITLGGGIHDIESRNSNLRSMWLTRKYPVRQYVYEVTRRIVGGEFHASNHPDFLEYVTVHKIKECMSSGHSVELPDTLGTYRYWRYKQDKPGTFCNMAEIAFFKHKGDSTSVRGEIIGTKGSFEDNPARRRDAVFDEDLLTFFDAPEWGGCWVGMDFGKPVAMGRIDFVPRGDGNNIDKGDIYELCIWDNGDWKSLGRQTATNMVGLEFSGVPVSGVYLLRNLTKGREERPFTYEDGHQIWW